jgi:ParB family chromosome partitioning protein
VRVNQRRGLGRGLGALIPGTPRAEPATSTPSSEPTGAPTQTVVAPQAQPEPTAVAAAPEVLEATPELESVPGVRYAELAFDDVRPNPRQPRTVFDEEALAELVHSIREIGLLQPIVVRPVPDAAPEGPHFELVAGERRWRAGREAGLDLIPAIVRETADDALLRDALLENLHRSQLNALEEAAAYAQMLDDFGCTQDELATHIGRSRPQVSNTLRLLRLPTAVQRRVAAGVLSAGHARALLGLDGVDAMDRLATRIVAEGLSVRAVEEIVAVGEGDGRERARVARPRRPTAPGLAEIADRLSDRLETRVRVESGKAKGKVTIEFATLDDLRRIVDVIAHD